MGLFSGVETDEVQSVGGFLKRFRGVRPPAFVEPGQGSSHHTALPGQEPAFREPTRAINPTVSFLGRKLSGDDVEDVDSFTEFNGSVAAPVTHRTVVDEPVAKASAAPSPAVSQPQMSADSTRAGLADHHAAPIATGADIASTLGNAYAEGEKALHELDALIASQRGAAEDGLQPFAGIPAAEPQNAPQQHPHPQPEQAPQPQPLSQPEAQVATRPKPVMSAAVPVDPPLPEKAYSEAPAKAVAEVEEDDSDEPTGEQNGRPVLVSADALPDFKRIVTGTDSDATLRLSAAARKEFVAVEIQPGIAIVAATARFSERAQFTTFVKDLAARDLLVQEEMIASEEVIAAIYEGKKRDVSTLIRKPLVGL